MYELRDNVHAWSLPFEAICRLGMPSEGHPNESRTSLELLVVLCCFVKAVSLACSSACLEFNFEAKRAINYSAMKLRRKVSRERI